MFLLFILYEQHYNDILSPKSIEVLHAYLKLLCDIKNDIIYCFNLKNGTQMVSTL